MVKEISKTLSIDVSASEKHIYSGNTDYEIKTLPPAKHTARKIF